MPTVASVGPSWLSTGQYEPTHGQPTVRWPIGGAPIAEGGRFETKHFYLPQKAKDFGKWPRAQAPDYPRGYYAGYGRELVRRTYETQRGDWIARELEAKRL
jgi:hypothetical protein